MIEDWGDTWYTNLPVTKNIFDLQIGLEPYIEVFGYYTVIDEKRFNYAVIKYGIKSKRVL